MLSEGMQIFLDGTEITPFSLSEQSTYCKMDGWIDELRFYVPSKRISVISRRWKGEHERLCAMKRRLGSGKFSPPAGFEPATPWSEVGSANRSATRTLRLQNGTLLKFCL